ncbi:MAG TPA: HisA/HisF-related TIM barrel protein [Pirellulales bacterium]|nr:HisA/HisF-related TIM barrel protein [Pirellulales bacterium]
MPTLRVIPVIDLKHGRVVRGVAGRREEYRPIESLLCDTPSPAVVGAAFRKLGFEHIYLADLDAIAGAQPDWAVLESLIDCGLRLWVDAGITSRERAAALARFEHKSESLAGIVVGLESMASPEELAATFHAIGPGRAIFSLDLRDGTPVVRAKEWQHISAEAIVREVVELGIDRIIVLDIARVGLGEGVGTVDLCRRLKYDHPALKITAGGGVRNTDDLMRLSDAGCESVLVASALHDGRLTAADLRRFGGVHTDSDPL